MMENESVNSVMNRFLTDPAGVAEWQAYCRLEREAKKQKLITFWQSETFVAMVEAMKQCRGRISDDDFFHFPTREKDRAGWKNFSDADIQTFFKLCESPDSTDFIDEGTLVWDDECPFPSASWEVSGIPVRWISGQGTFVTIGF